MNEERYLNDLISFLNVTHTSNCTTRIDLSIAHSKQRVHIMNDLKSAFDLISCIHVLGNKKNSRFLERLQIFFTKCKLKSAESVLWIYVILRLSNGIWREFTKQFGVCICSQLTGYSKYYNVNFHCPRVTSMTVVEVPYDSFNLGTRCTSARDCISSTRNHFCHVPVHCLSTGSFLISRRHTYALCLMCPLSRDIISIVCRSISSFDKNFRTEAASFYLVHRLPLTKTDAQTSNGCIVHFLRFIYFS